MDVEEMGVVGSDVIDKVKEHLVLPGEEDGGW